MSAEHSYKNLNEKEKKQYSVLWVLFILFGLVWLWFIFKPTQDFMPNLNTPLPPEPEGCTSPSGDIYPC